jgi:hypothetical protein
LHPSHPHPPPQGHRQHQQRGGTWASGKPLPAVRRTIECSGRSRGLKDAVAALNKINDRNYASVLQRMVQVVESRAASMHDVCDLAFSKCASDDGYLHVYMRLFLDIRAAFEGSTEADVLREGIDAFVRAFWTIELQDDAGAASTSEINPAERYDEFCAVLKARRLLLGKHRTVVGLIKNALSTELDTNAHMERLVGLLRVSCGATGALGFNDSHVDVAVDFIRDFVEAFPLSAQAHAADLAVLFDGNVVGVCSSMCRFKVHDLMDRWQHRKRVPAATLAAAPKKAPTQPISIPKQHSRRW